MDSQTVMPPKPSILKIDHTDSLRQGSPSSHVSGEKPAYSF